MTKDYPANFLPSLRSSLMWDSFDIFIAPFHTMPINVSLSSGSFLLQEQEVSKVMSSCHTMTSLWYRHRFKAEYVSARSTQSRTMNQRKANKKGSLIFMPNQLNSSWEEAHRARENCCFRMEIHYIKNSFTLNISRLMFNFRSIDKIYFLLYFYPTSSFDRLSISFPDGMNI